MPEIIFWSCLGKVYRIGRLNLPLLVRSWEPVKMNGGIHLNRLAQYAVCKAPTLWKFRKRPCTP